jgi:tetratricopeptide (TPR) repeat protein
VRTLPDLEGLTRFDERLRQVAEDRAAVERAIDAAREQLDRVEAPEEVSMLLAYLGNACRAVGRLDEALAYHCAALGGERSSAALIRLGETHRCREEYVEAERVLRQALDQAVGTTLEDFALEHLGKTLVDRGDASAAQPLLERALELRRKKGNVDLVASTEAALARARALSARF